MATTRSTRSQRFGYARRLPPKAGAKQVAKLLAGVAKDRVFELWQRAVGAPSGLFTTMLFKYLVNGADLKRKLVGTNLAPIQHHDPEPMLGSILADERSWSRTPMGHPLYFDEPRCMVCMLLGRCSTWSFSSSECYNSKAPWAVRMGG